jgi:uncharacterized protein YbjT (DUF2867 family)
MKTAIVLGATGLVGSQLLRVLLDDNRFGRVIILVRRPTNISHSKLEEHVVNFDKPEEWKHVVKGDVLFSAFGTTIQKAGSKEAQYKIDYTYQYEVAKAASQNGVSRYVLVSAAYSSPDSKVFYSRIKGELDRDVSALPFEAIHILRPGMLDGKRKEKRVGETVGIAVMSFLSRMPGLGSLKPINDIQVARAMINAGLQLSKGIHIYTLGELFPLSGR